MTFLPGLQAENNDTEVLTIGQHMAKDPKMTRDVSRRMKVSEAEAREMIQKALKVECPYCGAKPNHGCFSLDMGGHRFTVHKKRLAAI